MPAPGSEGVPPCVLAALSDGGKDCGDSPDPSAAEVSAGRG